MPSLKEQAQTIRNETQAGANTSERIGQFMEESAEVTETVDTIADLRAFDTTQLSNGDYIRVLGHTVKGIGGGIFEWNTTPLFSINNVGGYSDANHGYQDRVTISCTPLSRSIGTDSHYGTNVKFENGAVMAIRVGQDVFSNNSDRGYVKGATSFEGSFENESTIDDDGKGITTGSVVNGEKAFFLDDGGVYIRPSYTGFDGVGIFERKLPEDGLVTIDMYGAIPNESLLDGAINECSAAIQKAFDSLFSVKIPIGNYYISNTLKIRRTKQYKSEGNKTYETLNRRKRATNDDKHTGQIYTDQNIDVLVLQGADIMGSSFFVNTTLCTTYTKVGFKVDMSYFSNRFRDLFYEYAGNRDTLTDAPDNGGKAFQVDLLNVTQPTPDQNLFASANGSLHTSNCHIRFTGVHTGIHATTFASGKALSANGIWFLIEHADYYKRGVHFESPLINCRFDCISWQTRPLLTEANKNTPIIEGVGRNAYLEGFLWDFSTTPEDGFYRNQVGVKMDTGPITLGPALASMPDSYFRGLEHVQNKNMDEVTNGRYQIPKVNLRPDRPFISQLHNYLLYWHKKATYSVNKYDGSTYNFDTNLSTSESLGIATNLDINNPNAFISNEGQGSIDYNAGFNADTDFVEILFDTTAVEGTRVSKYLYITLKGVKPKKIQVIKNGESSTKEISDSEDLLTYRLDVDTAFGVGELIVRLIGAHSEGTCDVCDIASAAHLSNAELPYIHKGGDQRIYGPLTVEDVRYTNISDDGTTEISSAPTTRRLYREITVNEILNSNTSLINLFDFDDNSQLATAKQLRYTIGTGTTNYSTNTSLELKHGSGNVLATINLSSLPLNNSRYRVVKLDPISGDHGLFIGQDFRLQTLNGNPTGGDKTIKIWLDYEEIG